MTANCIAFTFDCGVAHVPLTVMLLAACQSMFVPAHGMHN